ncbi:hypothetical protein [Xanthobacter autotrophicus]|uniref:hypothetical protein n=1 Tax=Xanthobacter autotrophicus TaxID=280 RepID=UPI00372D8175
MLSVFALIFLSSSVLADGPETDKKPIRNATILNSASRLELLWSPGPYLHGNWGPISVCPEGTFASGFDLLWEPPTGDDTALNAIRLICRNKDGTASFTIRSGEGPWGSAIKTFECPQREFLFSYQLSYEPYGRDAVDDTGANGLLMSCRPLESDSEQGSKEIGDKGPWPVAWTRRVTCGRKSLIVGFETNVEPSCGSRCDDTALDDVRFFCVSSQ